MTREIIMKAVRNEDYYERIEAMIDQLVEMERGEAYDEGYLQGFDDGYSDGKDDGYDVGFDEGFQEGSFTEWERLRG